ncbi:Alcohol dehydrogenase [acceptor] [Providencia alcalifaciens]|nr:Alcohol dehydrogenase [acceptor] [Providencia alcalifaciens]
MMYRESLYPPLMVFSLKVGYLQPKSRGKILLRSQNPQDPLKIHANYLADPEDMEGCKRAVKFGLDVLSPAIIASCQ